MPRAGGAENFWVSESHDDGRDRTWWKAAQCPCSDKCSKQAWGRSQCMSLESEEKRREYVQLHLMYSGMHVDGHESSEAVSRELAASCEVETLIETFADREHYREQMQKHHTHNPLPDDAVPPRKKAKVRLAAKGGGKSSGGGPSQVVGGKGSGGDPSQVVGGEGSGGDPSQVVEAVRELASATREMVQMQQSAMAASSSMGDAQLSMLTPTQPRVLDLVDLHEANATILQSLQSVSAAMIGCLRTINDESMKLRQGQELLSQLIRRSA